ncbi:lecithin retinol acyltransferase family protein [Colwellia sp. MEBiC06753]
MPLPLFWLGAAAISALAVKELADDRKKQQHQRRDYSSERLNPLDIDKSPVAIYPSELFNTEQIATPTVGSILCCGIGGLLDHTGIWVGDNTIIELDGNGLVKPVSKERFTKERSGKHIFVACDANAIPLSDEVAAHRAIQQIYQYREYDLIKNNCHHFVWQCFEPGAQRLTTFSALNKKIAKRFNQKIYWDLCQF